MAAAVADTLHEAPLPSRPLPHTLPHTLRTAPGHDTCPLCVCPLAIPGCLRRLCGNSITGTFTAVAYHDGSVDWIACRLALVKVGEYFDARGKGG